MTGLSAVSGGATRPVDEFEVAYVTADGVEVRRTLPEVRAAPLEAGPPVRRFRPYKGQKHG